MGPIVSRKRRQNSLASITSRREAGEIARGQTTKLEHLMIDRNFLEPLVYIFSTKIQEIAHMSLTLTSFERKE
jgi:hypothetical protein